MHLEQSFHIPTNSGNEMTSGATVVFGGSGFIGGHLLRRLQIKDIPNLVSVDYRVPKRPLPGVKYILHDVRDLSGLEFGDVKKIYNLAAIHTTPGHETSEYYETNILGALEVCAFARRKNVDSVIFTSSISVYGPSEETKDETSRPDPSSAYGWSKLLAEKIHKAWCDESSERKLVICRPAVIFGPGENGNFTRLAKLLRKGIFIYPGRKDTIKACFYVEDLISALFEAENRCSHITVFNGAYPDRYTLQQIVETFRHNHFPKSRTFMVPRFFVTIGARILQPFSSLGLGIHPERVLKLVRSTDIYPQWLLDEKVASPDMLASAFLRWSAESNGRFD